MLHITIYNQKLREPEEIYNLAELLSQYFPAPEEFRCGIYELLLNAIEHGNLEIGFEEKTTLIRKFMWHEEIARRVSSPKFAHKKVHIQLTHDVHECKLTISDEGKGFPWQEFIGQQIDDTRPNGRGLCIAYSSPFDYLRFNARGNEVTCVASYNKKQKGNSKPEKLPLPA